MASVELSHGHHQYVFLVDGKPVPNPNASGKTRHERNEPVPSSQSVEDAAPLPPQSMF
jgi:hypothetical protein